MACDCQASSVWSSLSLSWPVRDLITFKLQAGCFVAFSSVCFVCYFLGCSFCVCGANITEGDACSADVCGYCKASVCSYDRVNSDPLIKVMSACPYSVKLPFSLAINVCFVGQ